MIEEQVSASYEDHNQYEEQKMNEEFPIEKIDTALMEAKLYVSADGGWLEIGTGEVRLHRRFHHNDEPYVLGVDQQNFPFPGADGQVFGATPTHSPIDDCAGRNGPKKDNVVETLHLSMVSHVAGSSSTSTSDAEEDFLLQTTIAQSCVYRVHEGTTLLWVDPELGKDIALSFSSRKACNYVMNAIQDFQMRASSSNCSHSVTDTGEEYTGKGAGNDNTHASPSSSAHGYAADDWLSHGMDRWTVSEVNLPYILESALSDPMHFGPYFRERSDYWKELAMLFREYHKRVTLRWNEKESRDGAIQRNNRNSNSRASSDHPSTIGRHIDPSTTGTTPPENSSSGTSMIDKSVLEGNKRDRNADAQEEAVLELLAQIGLALLRTPYTTDSDILAQFVDSMDDCIDIVQYGLGRKNKRLGFVSEEERRASFRNPCELDVEMREQIHVLYSCNYLRDLLPLSLEEVDMMTGNASPLIELLESFKNSLVEKICTSDKWLRSAFRRYTDYSPPPPITTPGQLTSTSGLITSSSSTRDDPGSSSSCAEGVPLASSSASRKYFSCSPFCDLANFVLDLSKTIKSSKILLDVKRVRYCQLFEAGMLPFFTALLYRYVHRSHNSFILHSREKKIEMHSTSLCSSYGGGNEGDGLASGEKGRGNVEGLPLRVVGEQGDEKEKLFPQPPCSTMPFAGVAVPMSGEEKEWSKAVQSVCETFTHTVMLCPASSLEFLLNEAKEAPPGKSTLMLIIQCVLCAGENAVQHSAFELVSSFFYQPFVETQLQQIISFWLTGSPTSSFPAPPIPPSGPQCASPLQEMVECLSSVFLGIAAQLGQQEKEQNQNGVPHGIENSSSPFLFSSPLAHTNAANPSTGPNNTTSCAVTGICFTSRKQLIALYSLKIIKVIIEYSDPNDFGYLCQLFHRTHLLHSLTAFLKVDAHLYMNLQSSAVGVVACLIKHSDKNAAAVAKLCTDSMLIHEAAKIFFSRSRRPSMYTCSLGHLISLIGIAVKDYTVLRQGRGGLGSPFLSKLPSSGNGGYTSDLAMDVFGEAPTYPLRGTEEESQDGHYGRWTPGREDEGLNTSETSGDGQRSRGRNGRNFDLLGNEEDANEYWGCSGTGVGNTSSKRSGKSYPDREVDAQDDDSPFHPILVSLLRDYEGMLCKYANTLYVQLRDVLERVNAYSKQSDESSSTFSALTDLENSSEFSSGTSLQKSNSLAYSFTKKKDRKNEKGNNEEDNNDVDDVLESMDWEQRCDRSLSPPPENSTREVQVSCDKSPLRVIGMKSGSERSENEEDESERKRGKMTV